MRSLKRISIILPVLMLILSASAIAKDRKFSDMVMPSNHVAFFFTAGMEYKEYRTAYADFLFSYDNSIDYLKSMGLTYSYHSRLPIAIPNGDLTLSLGKKNLSQSAGVILIKGNGKFRVLYGIYKSSDLINIASDYFAGH